MFPPFADLAFHGALLLSCLATIFAYNRFLFSIPYTKQRLKLLGLLLILVFAYHTLYLHFMFAWWRWKQVHVDGLFYRMFSPMAALVILFCVGLKVQQPNGAETFLHVCALLLQNEVMNFFGSSLHSLFELNQWTYQCFFLRQDQFYCYLLPLFSLHGLVLPANALWCASN